MLDRPNNAASAPRYPMIVLEGPDASGKTSIRKWLFQRAHQAGIDLLSAIAFNYLSAAATRVITDARHLNRPYPTAEITQAYVRDKELLGRTMIAPHRRWRPILIDRYIASDMVYHNVLWDIPFETTYEAYMRSEVIVPDLTLLIVTPVEIAQERLRARDRASVRRWDTPEMQARIYSNFHDIYTDARWSGLGRVVLIDNSGSLEETLEHLEATVVPVLLASVTDSSDRPLS